ncbi:hypothetical protein [Pseudomonas fluorescens]|uniref:hypothetical protein n=1 Tax=Pseudomonas fluorescens TaxID=294 RepID=UPI001CD31D17|nr:hypothetical protein [Pseudomonas fluorescens]
MCSQHCAVMFDVDESAPDNEAKTVRIGGLQAPQEFSGQAVPADRVVCPCIGNSAATYFSDDYVGLA